MKIAFVLLLTLVTSAALAANDSIKICNPNNQQQALEVKVVGGNFTMTNINGSHKETDTIPVVKTKELSVADLRDVAAKLRLPISLEAGTAYAMDDGVYLIANDNMTIKYLVIVLGGQMQLMGKSDSCK